MREDVRGGVEMTRREMLQGCSAAMALKMIGATGLLRAASPTVSAPGTLWTNTHGNLRTRVSKYFDVWNDSSTTGQAWRSGCAALRRILDEAQTAGHRVRAVGGRWSLSPVAISPDVMINTLPLNHHAVGLPARYVSSTDVDPAHVVFAQCGTSVAELNSTLQSYGLSLPTSGASNGQTIAGAIATGTHGSARRVGSMQDFMLGLHVLAEDGRSVWIEPASRPVVSDEFCAWIGATLVRDDRLFRAAVVSFGSFGIVQAVLFRAEPIFLLDVQRVRMDWPAVAHAAATLDAASIGLAHAGEEPFHFDVIVNPYRIGRGQKGALVTVMRKIPYQRLPRRRRVEGKLVPGIDLLGIAGRFATVVPASIPGGVSAMFDDLMKRRGQTAFGTHGEVFGDTELIGASLSSEIGVDLSDAGAAVEVALDEARRYPFPGTLGLRYVRGSDALLAFTRFDTTCTIEMTGAGSDRTVNYYRRVWSALDSRAIPFTQHWGKVHELERRSVRQQWGSAADDWLAARREFLSPAGRAMFSNDLLAKCELHR